MEEKKKFREIDHPADIAVEVYGLNLNELFHNALDGLLFLALDKAAGSREAEKKEKISLKALNYEELLINFLNEVLYLINVRKLVPAGISGLKIKNCRLEADMKISGSLTEKDIKQEIKAATYHNLNFKGSGPYKVKIYFDT